jgi:hypothetical protein
MKAVACGIYSAAWLLFGSAVMVSSQTTISPSNFIYVRENSPATFSCSLSDPDDYGLHLNVGGTSSPEEIPLTINSTQIDQSKSLNVLGGFYTLREFNKTLAKVVFEFTATRAFNGYTLQCESNITVSETITLHVFYPPSPVKNEIVHQFLGNQPNFFQLNCSDLLTGDPLPVVTWDYDRTWKFSVEPIGQSGSLLNIRITSLDMVPASLYNDTVTIVCTANNTIGSVSKSFFLSVTGTPSAPQHVVCMPSTESLNCAISCTWTAPLVSGTKPISSYNLVIRKEGVVVYNETLPSEVKEHSPPVATLPHNGHLSVSMRAVSALGQGPNSKESMFISPGPCMKTNLTEVTKNETFVTVDWKTPDCNVNSFTVNATSKNETIVFSRSVKSQTQSLLIGPLRSNTTYRVSVTSVNCAGASEPAQLTVTTSEPQTTTKSASCSACLQNVLGVSFFIFLSLLVGI